MFYLRNILISEKGLLKQTGYYLVVFTLVFWVQFMGKAKNNPLCCTDWINIGSENSCTDWAMFYPVGTGNLCINPNKNIPILPVVAPPMKPINQLNSLDQINKNNKNNEKTTKCVQI